MHLARLNCPQPTKLNAKFKIAITMEQKTVMLKHQPHESENLGERVVTNSCK